MPFIYFNRCLSSYCGYYKSQEFGGSYWYVTFPVFFFVHNHLITLLSAAGLDVKLTEEEIKYLEEPYKPQNIVGHS